LPIVHQQDSQIHSHSCRFVSANIY